MSYDARTNTLIVSDIPDKVTKVRELVAMLDKPVRQVLIEARIVIAQEGFRKQIGARFGVSGADQDSDGNLITVGGNLAATDYHGWRWSRQSARRQFQHLASWHR